MRKPLIAVIMATYNGDKFLIEQLDSILNQKNVNVHLYISDDGSTDQTIPILKQYFKNYPKQFKKLFHTNYCNPAMNFLSIIKKIETKYKYYAFSDQDDIWLPKKLNRGILKIKSGYDLYGSRTINTDKNLNFISYSPSFTKNKIFKNAIMQSFAGGNTYVFNKKIFKLLKIYSPLKVPMHDWWIYIFTTFIGGKVYYDYKSFIKYRMHENNVNGHNLGFINKLKRIYKALKNQYKIWNDMNVNNIYKISHLGTRKNILVYKYFISLRKQKFPIYFFKKLFIYRQKKIDQFLLKIGYFLNKI
jgi:glycosyltransferase involved in cell wall biosynthesis